MKRLSAFKVLRLSLIACLACLLIAGWVFAQTRSPWALLPLALSVWFAVDALRARGWLRGDPPKS